jgi:hypothetical protein
MFNLAPGALLLTVVLWRWSGGAVTYIILARRMMCRAEWRARTFSAAFHSEKQEKEK